MKRVLPYTPQWEQKANLLARNFAPSISPCVECGNPTLTGYCCTYCGSIDPHGSSEQRMKFQTWVNQQKSQ